MSARRARRARGERTKKKRAEIKKRAGKSVCVCGKAKGGKGVMGEG